MVITIALTIAVQGGRAVDTPFGEDGKPFGKDGHCSPLNPKGCVCSSNHANCNVCESCCRSHLIGTECTACVVEECGGEFPTTFPTPSPSASPTWLPLVVAVDMTLTGKAPASAGQTWAQYLNASKAEVQAALASECDVPAQSLTGLVITAGTSTDNSNLRFDVDMAQPVELLQDTCDCVANAVYYTQRYGLESHCCSVLRCDPHDT